jgi:hypothetical protein
MRKNGVACASIHKKTPVRQLVDDVDQRARDDGVEAALAI